MYRPSGKHQEDWLHAEESLKEGIHFYVKVSMDCVCGREHLGPTREPRERANTPALVSSAHREPARRVKAGSTFLMFSPTAYLWLCQMFVIST